MGILWLNDVDVLIASKNGKVHGKFFDSKPFTIKGTRALPKIPLVSATQMKRCLRDKNIFAIDICKISDESEPICEEPIIVEDFLANYHDIFLNELP